MFTAVPLSVCLNLFVCLFIHFSMCLCVNIVHLLVHMLTKADNSGFFVSWSLIIGDSSKIQ